MFLLLTLLSLGFGICPFAGAWLLCGELSTLPLNARFFLVNSGMGASSAMAAANAAFAVYASRFQRASPQLSALPDFICIWMYYFQM
jgi:hypothetical protein